MLQNHFGVPYHAVACRSVCHTKTECTCVKRMLLATNQAQPGPKLHHTLPLPPAMAMAMIGAMAGVPVLVLGGAVVVVGGVVIVLVLFFR